MVLTLDLLRLIIVLTWSTVMTLVVIFAADFYGRRRVSIRWMANIVWGKLVDWHRDVRAFVLGEQDMLPAVLESASDWKPAPPACRPCPEFSIDIRGEWSFRQAQAVARALAPEADRLSLRLMITPTVSPCDPSPRYVIESWPPMPGEIRIIVLGPDQAC